MLTTDCPGTDGNGYVTVTLCDGANNACCGDNGACCSDPDKLFKLPYFTNLKHPGPSPDSTDEDAKTVTMTVTRDLSTSSTTSPPPESASSDVPSDASSADSQITAANAANSDQAMKVGLGVGIPLGILLLAAVGYLIWELRKKRKAMAAGPGGAIRPVYEADSTNAMANHATMPMMEQSQSPAPKYHPYPQSFPSAELPDQTAAAYQLPAEDGLGRGELDSRGYQR